MYATFQALEEERRLIQSKSVTWHDWPKQFLTLGQPVREYAKRHWKRVRFFQYIQWVASGQLNEIQRTVEHLAMPIGLYHDPGSWHRSEWSRGLDLSIGTGVRSRLRRPA